MITLKTQRGEHIVTVDNVVSTFNTPREALEFIFMERGLLK